MIDWTAVVEGTMGAGALGAWFFRVREQVGANRTRLKAHEDACTERYGAINATMNRIERTLEGQNLVADQRNTETQQHREGVQLELGRIHASIAVLEENKRMRERHEDRR